MPEKIGEVIEASTTEFTAQCYELHQPPPFGSLVEAREGEVEDIYRSSLQLARMLRSKARG